MPNVNMLNVLMLSVVAPFKQELFLEKEKKEKKEKKVLNLKQVRGLVVGIFYNHSLVPGQRVRDGMLLSIQDCRRILG
jgi:hypothetical protein